MALPPIVALEIGTSKVAALVGEMREDGNIMITGIGEQESKGVRKGAVIDLETAALCVKSALQAAEENGKVEIHEVHLVVSGGHFRSTINRGSVPVLNPDKVITNEDIEEVMEMARAVSLPDDRDVLHTICQHFCIDEQQYVVNPEGMEGSKLALDMLVLHGVRSRIRNTIRVVRSIPLEVLDVAFSGLCSALAVLTPEQKQGGVIVMDLGGGTTDYVAYAEDVIAAAGALGVGGDHVTNDIAQAFNIPNHRAETLKKENGMAVRDDSRARQEVALPAEVGFPGRNVNLLSLDTVIHARMEETLMMIKKQLDDDGITRHIGAGVVLTGGGAHLNGVGRLIESIFGLPCIVGKPKGMSGLVVAADKPEYAACCGLIQYGFKNAAEKRDTMRFGQWIKHLFAR